MTIQIYGTGCPKCRILEANAVEAARSLDLDVEVQKVSDLSSIAAAGVRSTPGLGIDGTVRSTGHLLSAAQIRRMLVETETRTD